MIANREECLGPAAINDLLLGRLPPDRFANALQHVESCERCTRAAEAAGGGSSLSWIEKAIKATDKLAFDHEPECHAAIGNLLLQSTSEIAANAGAGALPTESLGPYRLLRWLGSGGMGSVYLAEHQRLRRLAAIKLLPREKLSQSGWLDRFNREMTSIASLEHAHVVRAIDAGDEGGWHFLVMEYLDGADLSKVCRRISDIPLPTACELVRQAALGLGAIHSLGMTHRDIKPSNLFLTRTGVVKLLDLGLVLSGDSPLAVDERLTTVGHLMGTVPYMPREQLVDASAVDWRADIYSLGATMYRLLAGRAPFGPASNLAQTIQAISTTSCPTLRSLKPDIPIEVAQLVDRMLSHDPQFRPQSAQEVAESLAPFCEADALQSLIRAALSCPEDPDQQPNSQLQFNQLTPLAALDNSGKSKSRWPFWMAAAIVPLAFFAGILITVTTDKGTLVIESEEPGVSVNVTQGDKVVETLRVEKQPSVLRLQSGKYIVELKGVEGDGLEVSDSRVALTRGDKQVVRIQQRRSATDTETIYTDSSKSQFQGKSIGYWMDLLDREKDIATIAQAMQAVELLAETEQARLEAARKCMLIARRLGGLVQSGRGTAANANPDASGWFMTEFIEVFPKFLPEPGFQVLVEELEHGTERSAQTCFLFLSSFSNTFGQSAPSSGLKLYFKQLAASEAGRDQLIKLDKLLEKQILRASQATKSPNTPNTVDFNSFEFGRSVIADEGVLKRIDVLNALDEDLSNHPQVAEWAKNRLAKAQATLEGTQPPPGNASFGGMGGMGGMGDSPGGMSGILGGGYGGMGLLTRSPLDPRIAMSIQKALSKQEYNPVPIILAYLEPADFFPTEIPLDSAFTTISNERPKEAAIAIVKHFERAQANEVFRSGTLNDARAKLAKEILLANPPDSIEVVKALAHAKAVQDPTSIFKKEDIDDLLRHMAVRLAREASAPGEGNAVVKDDIALHVFFQVGIPDEQASEVAELLMPRERSTALPAKSASMPLLSEHIKNLLGGTPNELNPSYLNRGLVTLFARYPKQFIEAYAKRLKSVNRDASGTRPLPQLIAALNSQTPEALRIVSARTYTPGESNESKDPLVEFLKSPEARVVIEQLDEAFETAIDRVADGNKQLTDQGFLELHTLLYGKFIASRFLGKEIRHPAIERGLRLLLVNEKSQTKLRTVSLGLLVYCASKFGYESIPFQLLENAQNEIAVSTNCDDIRQLVVGIRTSRPKEFCEYFTARLELIATNLEAPSYGSGSGNQNQAMRLFGKLDAECDEWYREIVQPLLEDPETRTRAAGALKKILNYLPPDSKEKQFLVTLLTLKQ